MFSQTVSDCVKKHIERHKGRLQLALQANNYAALSMLKPGKESGVYHRQSVKALNNQCHSQCHRCHCTAHQYCFQPFLSHDWNLGALNSDHFQFNQLRSCPLVQWPHQRLNIFSSLWGKTLFEFMTEWSCNTILHCSSAVWGFNQVKLNQLGDTIVDHLIVLCDSL